MYKNDLPDCTVLFIYYAMPNSSTVSIMIKPRTWSAVVPSIFQEAVRYASMGFPSGTIGGVAMGGKSMTGAWADRVTTI
jgi:hypothetical protein